MEEGLRDDPFSATPYRAVRSIGMGGSARVYELAHRKLGKLFVGKLLLERLASDQRARQRMEQEAYATAAVRHPHLVDIVDFCTVADGRPLIVMERLEGANLRAELDARGPLPLWEAVRYARQALLALSAAHQRGIVHRDLKPENLFVHCAPTGERVLKVLDLGLAKLLDPNLTPGGRQRLVQTEKGVYVGTPGYVSPEEVLGEPVDGRADIYALGVVLYELVTGRRPFGDHPAAHGFRDPPIQPSAHRAGIPRALDRVLLRALQPLPSQRFRTASDFARALADLEPELGHTPGSHTKLVLFSALASAIVTFNLWRWLW